MDNDKLRKALQLYIEGKNNIDKNDTLAKNNFMKTLEALTEIKNLESSSKYMQLIQTTEADCRKFLQTHNIFDLVTRNCLDKIKKLDYINFREINDTGNTILHHAVEVGDTSILKELLKKGGMIDTVNGNGHTLLEYACLKNDPNMIAFVIAHGGNMKKHLFFRKGDQKQYLHKSDIDMAILLKLVTSNSINKNQSYQLFSCIEKYFNMNELVGLDKFTVRDVLIGLNNMFNNKESYKTYINIIIEELNEFELNKTITKCIYNKIDILLSNLVPFINYPFNIASIFLLKSEIKYLIKNILKNNKNFKDELMEKLFDIYIKTNLFQEDYIGIIVYNILSKIEN
jgi:ankyrin repeat protein